MAPSKKRKGKKAISSSKKKPTADRSLYVQDTEVCGSQGPLASRLESESRPSSNGAEEISKADEFKYLPNYQVFRDEVVIKKYALYTTLDFNFDAFVREMEADIPQSPRMQLANKTAVLRCSGRGTKATNLVECMIADS
ncbi:hypothetical protein V1506DRAFT_509020 [Lipomyces tetrasporus]